MTQPTDIMTVLTTLTSDQLSALLTQSPGRLWRALQDEAIRRQTSEVTGPPRAG